MGRGRAKLRATPDLGHLVLEEYYSLVHRSEHAIVTNSRLATLAKLAGSAQRVDGAFHTFPHFPHFPYLSHTFTLFSLGPGPGSVNVYLGWTGSVVAYCTVA